MNKEFFQQAGGMKTIVLIIVFILVIFFLMTSDQPAKVAQVIMTDEAYSPETLTILPGTKVVFLNQGEQPHWPASNFHPTHTLYPELGGCIGSKLDACEGIEPGATYEFIFNEVGSWSVHDHIFPGLTMTIIVSESEVSVTDSFDFDLEGLPSPELFRDLSYAEQDSLVKLMSQHDPVGAWGYLKTAFYVDGQVLGNAHEFSHLIGNSIYKQLGIEGIINCDSTFAFGCYHGVSEELLQDQGADAVLSTQEQCIELYPPQDTNLYTGCIHGMGHGLLTWEGLNVSRALQGCDLLDRGYRNFCYDGVFMENSFLAVSEKFDAGKFWNFCLDLAETYHYNCGRYQTQRIFGEFSFDFQAMGAECAQAPNSIFIETCAESMGYFASQTTQGDQARVLEQCGKIRDEEVRSLCVIGGAREAIFQEYQDWQATSTALCRSLSGSWETKCFESNEKVREIYNRG